MNKEIENFNLKVRTVQYEWLNYWFEQGFIPANRWEMTFNAVLFQNSDDKSYVNDLSLMPGIYTDAVLKDSTKDFKVINVGKNIVLKVRTNLINLNGKWFLCSNDDLSSSNMKNYIQQNNEKVIRFDPAPRIDCLKSNAPNYIIFMVTGIKRSFSPTEFELPKKRTDLNKLIFTIVPKLFELKGEYNYEKLFNESKEQWSDYEFSDFEMQYFNYYIILVPKYYIYSTVLKGEVPVPKKWHDEILKYQKLTPPLPVIPERGVVTPSEVVTPSLFGTSSRQPSLFSSSRQQPSLFSTSEKPSLFAPPSVAIVPSKGELPKVSLPKFNTTVYFVSWNSEKPQPIFEGLNFTEQFKMSDYFTPGYTKFKDLPKSNPNSLLFIVATDISFISKIVENPDFITWRSEFKDSIVIGLDLYQSLFSLEMKLENNNNASSSKSKLGDLVSNVNKIGMFSDTPIVVASDIDKGLLKQYWINSNL